MQRKIKSIWLILLFSSNLFSPGCVRVPDCDLAQVMEEAGSESVLAQALDRGGYEAGDWPTQTWWRDLGDPVLNQLIEEALQKNPNLKAAESRLKAAAQVALQKRGALYPEIDFVINDNWEHLAKQGFFRAFAPQIPPVVNDFNLDFSFTYEVDFWGKYRDLFNAALGDAAAQAAEKLQVELILTTSIAYAYAELQFLLRERQIIEKRNQNREEILAIRDKRVLHALDTSIEHLTSKGNKLDIESSLLDVDPKIEEQVHKIKALSGLGQDAILDIEYIPLNPLTIQLPERLSLDLISRRPDLIAQKARVEAAAKRIDAAKTDFYPNVNITTLLGIESVFWSKLFRKENYSGSFQPALNLPIFTAGRLRAQLDEKVADFNEAVHAYNNLILLAAQQVADSLSTLFYIQKEIEVRESSLQVIEKQEYLTRRRVEHALDDRIAYLEAQNAVLEMQLIVETMQYSKQLAGILLIRALGGGYGGGTDGSCS